MLQVPSPSSSSPAFRRQSTICPALYIGIATAAMACSGGEDEPPALEQAIDAVGGRDALAELTGVQLTSRGTWHESLEGYRPGEPVEFATLELTASYQLRTDEMRLQFSRDNTFGTFAGHYEFTDTITGEHGFTAGGDDLIFGLRDHELSTARISAIRKRHKLLHPHYYLRAAALDKGIVRESDPDASAGGDRQRSLTIADPGGAVRLFIDRETGEITRAETIENDHLLGDVVLEASYRDWRAMAGSEARFPHQVVLTLDGVAHYRETRSSIASNPSLAGDAFDVPDQPRTVHVGDDVARGALSSQWFERARAEGLGITLDAIQSQVEVTELGDPGSGVVLLTGAIHHSLAIAMDDGIILVEAPLYEARSRAILAELARLFPGKPVTHVIATHHHFDHMGGIRTIAAAGADVVVSQAGAEFAESILARPHSLVPDDLEKNPRAVAVTAVGGEPLVLADDTREVRVLQVPTAHAVDMVMVYVADLGLIFNSDLYAPGVAPAGAVFEGPPLTLATELDDAVNAAGLAVETIAGGHGVGVDTVQTFRGHIGR